MFRPSKPAATHMKAYWSARGSRRRGTRVIAIAALAMMTAGCDDYLERRETITLGAGDANAVNRATQTIDRWPEAARHDRWLSDGERGRRAVEAYRKGANGDPTKAPEASGGPATESAETKAE